MPELNTVATPISAACWAAELQELASRADALERNPDATLADRLDLAPQRSRACGWPGARR